MKTIRLDGKDFEVGSDAHLAKLDEMAKAELAKVTKERDEAQGRFDAADKALAKAKDDAETTKRAAAEKEAEDDKKFKSRIRAKMRLFRDMTRLFGKDEDEEDDKDGGKEQKMDALIVEGSDRDAMLFAIQKTAPEFTADGKSDDYVTARFDSIVKQAKSASGVDGVVRTAEKAKADLQRFDAANGPSDADVEAARLKNKQDRHNAWKTPMGANGVAK